MQKNFLASVLWLSGLLLSACAGAAATPTSTATTVSTATPTLTPTPAPTGTPTPETSIRIAEMADGSSVLFDLGARYHLTVPRDWITTALSAADLENALSVFQDDPEMQNLVETLSASQAEPRLLAYPRLEPGSIPPIALTVALQPDAPDIPMVLLVPITAAGIALAVPEAQVTSTDTRVNAQGVELGLIEVTLRINAEPVGSRQLALRAAAFMSGDYLVVVSLIWEGDLLGTADQVWPGITDSITLDPE
jgi:hypothetical protein